MRNIWKSVVCLVMAVTLFLTDAPAYVYAAKNNGTIAAVETVVPEAEAGGRAG